MKMRHIPWKGITPEEQQAIDELNAMEDTEYEAYVAALMKPGEPRPFRVGDMVITDRYEQPADTTFQPHMEKFVGKAGKIQSTTGYGKAIQVHGWWWPASALTHVDEAPPAPEEPLKIGDWVIPSAFGRDEGPGFYEEEMDQFVGQPGRIDRIPGKGKNAQVHGYIWPIQYLTRTTEP